MKHLILFFAFFVLVAGCSSNSVNQMTFSGTLEITEHKLGAKVPGRLISVTKEEGDHVKAGEVIAVLDRFEQNKKDYERTLRLYKQGGANQQAVEYALLNMQDQQVISPIDGIVLVKVHEAGEVIAAGSPVIVLGDTKDQWVKVFVHEGIINQLKKGQNAVITFDGVKEKYQGHIRSIATKAEFTPRNVQTPEERVTQVFAVKVVLDHDFVQAHPGVAADLKFE